MLNGREALRDCTNDLQRVDQLQMEKLKLSQGMDYLRQRIKAAEADNRRMLDQTLTIKNLYDELRQEQQRTASQLQQQKEQRKKLQQLVNSRNQVNGTLQRKAVQLQQQNTQLKQKLTVMADKQNSLLAKRNNHFSCVTKEKQLKDRLTSTEKELMALNEKYEENRVKLQGLEIRQESTTAQNRKLKKLLDEKEQSFLELRGKCERLQGQLQTDESDRKEMLDSLFQMINAKQSELQQKQTDLQQSEQLVKDMAAQLNQLLLQNRHLQQLNSKFAPIDPTVKHSFTELKQLAEKVGGCVGQQLLSRLLRAEEQYGQLEQLYDKMVVKLYQSSASCRDRQ